MYKIIFKTILFFFILVIGFIIYFSTAGFKTTKLNDFIIEKIKKVEPKISIEIEDVYLVLNLKEQEIRARTKNTNIYLKNNLLKLSEVNINLDLISFLKNEKSVKNLEIKTKENTLKKLVNFAKSYKFNIPILLLEQKVKNGNIIVKAKFNFDKNNGNIIDYAIDGSIKNSSINLAKDINPKNINFDFEIKKNLYLIKNLKLTLQNIKFNSKKIDIKKIEKKYTVNGNFENIKNNISPKFLFKFFNLNYDEYLNEKINIKTNNEFSFVINRKFKIEKVKINSNLYIEEIILNYNSKDIKFLIPDYNNKIKLKNISSNLSYFDKKLELNGKSDYTLNDKMESLSFNYKLLENKNNFDFILGLNNIKFKIDQIDYFKNENTKAFLKIKGEYNNNKIKFSDLGIKDKNNLLFVKNLKFDNSFKILNFDEIVLNYKNSRKFKNNIKIIRNKSNYYLSGSSFDFSKYLDGVLKGKNKKSLFEEFKNLNSKLVIKIDKVYLDSSEKNNLLNLNGSLKFSNNKIRKGSIKSKYLNNGNFSLSINSTNNEKVTTLYSDIAEPFVNKFDFVKGFKNGKLDFYSANENNISNSTVKIYDFKLKEVPVLTKILSLASLQGIADLMTGEGIRFDDFEMTFNNKKNLMTIEEIYSIGPAISILMSGYVEKDKLISLRGTLVPATTINRTIGTIPILGDILIGKKTGEGVFGVSFKIKGPPKNLKTTVNPVKTLTPRFITRTIEKIKKN